LNGVQVPHRLLQAARLQFVSMSMTLTGPETAIGPHETELRLMQTKHPDPELSAQPLATVWAPDVAQVRPRRRPSSGHGSREHGALVRRIIVLAERFKSLCVLKSDPLRLVDLLASVIASSRECFAVAATGRVDAPHGPELASEQARCLKDLEILMHGLMLGAPEASRGLGHAMDALLIQCVLLEYAASPGDAGQASAAG
jgi:hypothetical protein